MYLSGRDVGRESNDITCSDDYKLEAHVRRSLLNANAVAELRNLKANSSCFILVEAFTKDGFSIGKQTNRFSTLAEPKSSWWRVKIRQSNVDNTLGYNANITPSLCEFSRIFPQVDEAIPWQISMIKLTFLEVTQ